MTVWIAPEQPVVPEEFLESLGISRFVGEILVRRGFTTVEQARAFLFEDAYKPSPPTDIPNLEHGVELVGEAIKEKKKIGVWGDFDVDGQTSTALLVSAFQQLGGDVVFHIPVRETESHGINIPNLKKMLELGIDILVTCDTGISAYEAVDHAKKHGVQVVITDHHDLPERLPNADAVINPSMLGEDHPLFTLPGVGVAYKFVEQLFSEMGRTDVDQFLDLAALGIVADVAAITRDTRYILKRGLRALHLTDRLGLKVLMEKAGVDQQILNEEDIGFSLAPRLNALGRLGDANVIVEFLNGEDESRIRVIAEQLEGLNAERKLLTSQVYQAAEMLIISDSALNKSSALILKGTGWPAGVVGIVASRIAEKYGKPTLLLTTSGDGYHRGSARSVNGCDITKAIASCADLLEGFGGHPMAAGVSLKSENVEAFRRRLDKAVKSQLGEDIEIAPKQYDAEISLDDISVIFLDEVRLLAPFGHANPALMFVAKDLRIANKTEIGRTSEHIRLIVEDQTGTQASVLWWRGAGEELPGDIFNMVFSLKANHFQGSESVQIEFVDYWLEPEVEAPEKTEVEIQVFDMRNNRLNIADAMLEGDGIVEIWGEGVKLPGYNIKKRDELNPADSIVIVTLPPSQKMLQAVLRKVDPKTIFWLGIDPDVDELGVFLKRLSGIVKYLLKEKNGKTNLLTLAGATAQSEETVRKGLQWLHAKAVFDVQIGEDGQISFSIPNNKVNKSVEEIELSLRALLGEAIAYRKYLKTLNSEEMESYIRGLIGGYG